MSAEVTEPRAAVSPHFTIADALRGLRARGLHYRPDVRQRSGLWTAQCPLCCPMYCDGEPLLIREGAGGRCSLDCANGCPRESVIVNLASAMQPTSIEARVRRLELLVLGGAQWGAA